MVTPRKDIPQIDGEDIIRLLSEYLNVPSWTISTAIRKIAEVEVH